MAPPAPICVPVPKGFPQPYPVNNPDGGGLVAPGYNFPGKGWRKTYRTRPVNKLDLSAKLHDLHYHINKVDIFSDRPGIEKVGGLERVVAEAVVAPVVVVFDGTDRGTKLRLALDEALAAMSPAERANKRKKVSRVAKADYIFRRMNEHARAEETHFGSYISWLSQQFFLDRESDIEKYWIANDGFRNVISERESWSALNDPSTYLMIPWESLSAPRPHRTRTEMGKYAVHRIQEADYESAHPQDTRPGFSAWFYAKYKRIFEPLKDVTSRRGG